MLQLFMLLLSVVEALTSEVRVAHVGSTVNLSCNTSDWKYISWEFSLILFDSWHDVYYYRNINDRLSSRYAASYNNLSINDVQLCDAGVYRCFFMSGDNLHTADIQLTVRGKFTC